MNERQKLSRAAQRKPDILAAATGDAMDKQQLGRVWLAPSRWVLAAQVRTQSANGGSSQSCGLN